MKLPERSNSNRMKKDQQKGRPHRSDDTSVAQDQPRRDVFESIDEAVAEHRKSMGKRLNTAARLDKRKRSLSKPRPAAREVKEPTRSEDLHLVGQTLEYQDGLDTFRFPTPSPRLPPPPRSATFQHSASPLQQQKRFLPDYESPRIGVAIGSPSNAPPSWGRSYTADHISTRMRQPPNRMPPAPPSHTTGASQTAEQRRKKTSWKTLGTIFRWTSRPTWAQRPQSQHDSNGASCSPPICSVDTSEASSPVLPSPSPKLLTKKDHRRLNSASPSADMSEFRSSSRDGTDRTCFMPALKSRISRVPYSRGSTTPSPRIKTHKYQDSEDVFSPKREERHDSPMSQLNAGIEALSIPRTPRLNLTFETPEFERYSVMFEKLLSNDSRPSLLERRQSRLQGRKSGRISNHDEDSGEHLNAQAQLPAIPQRSLTSPHLSRPLAIKIEGKNTQVQGTTAEGPSAAMHRPMPLARSNTAPPGAVSPVTAVSRQRKATLESSPESPGSTLFSEAPIPTPTTVTTCTDRESIQKELEQAEPTWNMVTSQPFKFITPPSVSTATTANSGKGKSSESYPRVKSPEDLERQIVQVSVARQVSVSRARSRVQKAVATSTFKQPLRPRVVELSKNRKSTAGVLESMDDDVPSVPSRNTSKAESDIRKEIVAMEKVEVTNGVRKREKAAEANQENQIPTIEVSDVEGDNVRPEQDS